jgi:putative methionine-R-sulfoxide reductase with GAF domain/mannose-6-phosphate isomerase-like protein (cupin superfamily)
MDDTTDVLTRLAAIAAGDADRAKRGRDAAEQIQRARGYRWVGLYDVTPSEISAIAWTGTAAPAFPVFPRTQGLNGAAVARERPIVINDVRHDSRYLTTFGSTLAEAIFPVRSGKTIVGTVDVESDRLDAFTPDDEQFLQQCAHVLAPLWSTPSNVRSTVVNLRDALAQGPPPPDNLAVPIFAHGTMAVEIYTPTGRDEQKPHDRDEVYLVVRGRGVFVEGETRHSVETGAFLFVAAGRPHRFEEFSPDFAVWVLFYGPRGGEVP